MSKAVLDISEANFRSEVVPLVWITAMIIKLLCAVYISDVAPLLGTHGVVSPPVSGKNGRPMEFGPKREERGEVVSLEAMAADIRQPAQIVQGGKNVEKAHRRGAF